MQTEWKVKNTNNLALLKKEQTISSLEVTENI